MGMSRTGVSDVLVVSWLVTSNSRMIGLAPCQSCLSAASARWTECCVRSQVTCSQNGSGTIRKMRSLATPPGVGFEVERSLSRLIGGGRIGAGFGATAGTGGSAVRGAGLGGAATGFAAAAAALAGGLRDPLVGLAACVPLVPLPDGLGTATGLVTFAALLAAGLRIGLEAVLIGRGVGLAALAAARSLAALAAARVRALTSSSFFMESQPRMFLRRAMLARSCLDRSFSEPAVVIVRPLPRVLG